MLISEIKRKFLTEWDEFQSAYISNTKLNDFFWDAQNQIYTDLMAKYQLTRIITDDIVHLVKRVPITPTSNLINLDTDITNYESLITVVPTYDNGYSFEATPLLAEEKNSYYAQGTKRYPRFELYSTSGNDRILEMHPIDTPVSMIIRYFINPLDIFFDVPDYDLPYTENAINNIIQKAKQIASSSFRDSEFFQTSSVLLDQTIKNP